MSDFEVKNIFDEQEEVCVDHAIIISGNRREEKSLLKAYIQKFRQQGFKVGFIHVGDEACIYSIDFYRDVDFVFRNYLRQEAQQLNKNCFYLPLGYKFGFCNELERPEISDRKYVWSFAGQPKNSRDKMLRVAEKIPGGFDHRTVTFNDPQGLSTKDYADLLSQTVFALCPRGNVSVDTFRLYEALEAGAIPIVEDRGYRQVLSEVLNPISFLKARCFKPIYWSLNNRYLKTESYWLQAYGSDFPCPRIQDWRSLEQLLAEIDIESTSMKIQDWWKRYKDSLRSSMVAVIEQTFFS